MVDFIQGQGPLSNMGLQEDEAPRVQAPTGTAPAPADEYAETLRQARKNLYASRATGMDPLTTFLLAASQGGPGGIGASISRGGIAAQQAMGEQAKSNQAFALKDLDLALEEAKYKDVLKEKASEAEKDRIAKGELVEKEIAAENKRLTEKLEDQARHDKEVIQGRIDIAALAAGNKPVPPITQKRIIDLATAANSAEQDAKRFNQVATDFEDLKPTGGFFGKYKEAAAKVFGTEDYQSYVRKEFQEIMRQGMLQNLPKGAASDADVRLVREAQLSDFANPALVPEVLRAMARIKQRNSDLLNFQSQYVSLNPLKTTVQEDQEIGGILIPKGSTFSSSLKLFNEKNPYSSSVIKTPEPEPEGDAAQGTGNSTKSSGKVDNENPLLKLGQ
jgi:hypothetical protein